MDGGGITALGAFRTFRKPCVAGCQNGKLCRFWVLAGCTPEERRKPAGQRCAYARRCSAGVAAPLGCVIFFAFVEIAACTPCAQGLSVCARRGVVSLPSACFACSRNAGRPLAKAANLPFSKVGWSSLTSAVQNVLDRCSLLVIDFKYRESIASRLVKKE